MRSSAPVLLPIFRSHGQARLLARIFLGTGPATVAQLARELKLDSGGISREANRLEDAGLIVSERIGNQRLLRPNRESPYFEELERLLLKAFGPVVWLGDVLNEVPGVEDAFIFGSWAARYLGEPGHAPRDIDILVVGKPDRRALARQLRNAELELGYELNPTVIPRKAWEQGASAFLRSVKKGPLVRIGMRDG